MKKIIFVLGLILGVTSSVISQDVHYTLVNPRVDFEEGTFYHLVDVLSYSNEGFKLGSGQLYINYDTIAFGPNVFMNDKLQIILPDSSVLNEKVGSPPFEFSFYGDIISNDNTFNRFSYSWQHDFSNDCLLEQNMNQYSDVLFTIKIEYKEDQEVVDPGICLEGSAVYVDQTFTACGPLPCNTSDCFNYPGNKIVADFYSCSECLIVYSTNDAGIGSLRAAISCAVAGDTIRFAPNLRSDSILLSSGQLDINKELYVIARHELKIVVQGELVNRVFDILNGHDILLEGLSIISGIAQQGSGVRNNGQLTIKDFTIFYKQGLSNGSSFQNLDSLTVKGINRFMQIQN